MYLVGDRTPGVWAQRQGPPEWFSENVQAPGLGVRFTDSGLGVTPKKLPGSVQTNPQVRLAGVCVALDAIPAKRLVGGSHELISGFGEPQTPHGRGGQHTRSAIA